MSWAEEVIWKILNKSDINKFLFPKILLKICVKKDDIITKYLANYISLFNENVIKLGKLSMVDKKYEKDLKFYY